MPGMLCQQFVIANLRPKVECRTSSARLCSQVAPNVPPVRCHAHCLATRTKSNLGWSESQSASFGCSRMGLQGTRHGVASCTNTSSVAVCVCVSTPGQRVFHRHFVHAFQLPFSTTFYKQGGREDLQGSAQRSSLQDPRKRKLITSVYLLVISQAVTLLFHGLFPWFFTPKPTRPQQLRRRSSAAVASLQMRINTLLKTPSIRSDSSPCR